MWHVWRKGEVCTGFLMRTPEVKRPLVRRRCRWEDNIKTGLLKVGCGGMDWVELPQDRDRWRVLVSTVMNFWIP